MNSFSNCAGSVIEMLLVVRVRCLLASSECCSKVLASQPPLDVTKSTSSSSSSVSSISSVSSVPSYDIIYIDGSHVARDVLLDACCSFALLNKNGIFMGSFSFFFFGL